MRKCILTFLAAAAGLAWSGPGRAEGSFIDWAGLKNPVLAEPDRMLKDPAVQYAEGWFYIFVSARREWAGPEAGTDTPRIYRTRDFKAYESFWDPDLEAEVDGGPELGPGSPDVNRIEGRWVMVFQAGPSDTRRRRLYYSTSPDLADWSPAAALNPSLRFNARRIDGALAYESGYYYLGYKSRQTFRVTRSAGPDLDGRWLPSRAASADRAWAENFQFIKIDGAWRMIATARDPSRPLTANDYTGNHEPYIYRMDGRGDRLRDWTRWRDRHRLEVAEEGWNRVMRANSAWLCDWREYDGYFYLFYAGSNDRDSFQGRGHAQIGVSRSPDLVRWRPAGDTGFGPGN